MLQVGASNEAVIERKIVRAAQYVRMSTEHHEYSAVMGGTPGLDGLGDAWPATGGPPVSRPCRPARAAAP